MERIPEYRATASGPTERGILSTLLVLAMGGCLWAALAWADTTPPPLPEPTPNLTPQVEPSPTPQAGQGQLTGPSAGGIAVAHPGAWTPLVPDFDDKKAYGHLPGYRQTVGLRSPLNGAISVSKGKKLFKDNCLSCHQYDGKPNPSLRVPARDLSNPIGYQYGSSDGAIFRSIKYGIPRSSMGRLKGQIKDQDIWHVVNFVKSIHRR